MDEVSRSFGRLAHGRTDRRIFAGRSRAPAAQPQAAELEVAYVQNTL